MTTLEAACRHAAERFLSMAAEEPDALRRLGLLDCAAGALSAARDHALVEAGAVLRPANAGPPAEQRRLEVGP